MRDRAFQRWFPLWLLLDPREWLPLVAGLGIGMSVLAGVLIWAVGMPIWGGTMLVLAVLAYPIFQKWRADFQQFGLSLTILSVLVLLQGFHTLEHIAQWVEFHMLHWPPRQAQGLISGANVEVVHFVWNWLVVALIGILLYRGLRHPWGWVLLVWSVAHSLEHTYLMWQYVHLLRITNLDGISWSFAQGQPGILGSHGWLARASLTSPTLSFFCGKVPALVQAPRLDIHFGWNAGEFLLLFLFADRMVRSHLRSPVSEFLTQVATGASLGA